MKNAERNLRRALLGNALFSTINALAALFFSSSLAYWMELPNPQILLVLGIGLLLFAVSIFYLLWLPKLNKKLVQSIIFQDGLWVLGSIVLLLWKPFGLPSHTHLLIGVISSIVAIFGILQNKYLKVLD